MHLIDEATRYSWLEVLPDKESGTIIRALRRGWFRMFEPPLAIMSDQESGIMSDMTAADFERCNTSRIPRPKDKHASVVERHNALVRDLLHKVSSQLDTEGIALESEDVVAEVMLA